MPIAICPSPPMLVPEVAGGAAGGLEEMRRCSTQAVGRLVGAGHGPVTVVGTAAMYERRGTRAGGTLRGYGVGLRAGGDEPGLGLALTLGAWLLDRAGWDGERVYVGVTGVETVDLRGPVLVMADGTAKRSASAPGHVDERAPGYDKAIAEALRHGDAAALAALDLGLAEQLWGLGVPALRTLGRSVGAAGVARARLLYEGAPYGVGYFVAEWVLAASR